MKKMPTHRLHVLALGWCLAATGWYATPSPAADGDLCYEQNFDGFDDGETDLGDGSVITSNDGTNSVQNGALRLTQAGTNSTEASFVLPPFDVSAGWSAIFDFTVEHSGGNTPADGFSFNFGEIPGPDDFGNPAEEGYGDGVPHISYQVDTWQWNDDAQDAGVGIEVAGLEVAYNPAKNDEANFKPDESVSASALVSWDPQNGVSFQTSGLRTNADFVNVPIEDFDAEADYGFSFLARTGGHNETVIIDNLAVGPPGSFELRVRDPKIDGPATLSLAAEFGKSSVSQLRVLNAGATQDLVIDRATLAGDSPGAFEVTTAFPVTLGPGEETLIDVAFSAPDALGSVLATLILSNNDTLGIAQNRVIELVGNPFAPTGSYIENFDGFANDTVDLEDGSIIFSNNDSAKIVDGTLQLTEDGIGGSSANFKLPALGPGGNEAFIVTFDLKLEAEGTPADGISFNYGNIPDNATGSEEGLGSGLAVEFDTWDNGGEGADSGIGYDISVDGNDVPDGQMRIEAGDDPRDNRFFKFDGQWRPVEIIWFKSGEDSGLLTLIVDDEVFYDSLPTPDFSPEPGYRFAFAARTGGAFETVQIDNLSVLTGTEDPNLFVTSRVASGIVQPDSGLQTINLPLRNTGTDTPLSISNVSLNPSDSEVYSLGAFPQEIAPGESAIIEITLDPSKAQGLVTADVVIESSDPSEPTQTVALSVSVPLSSGLLAWYKMDETVPGPLLDSSGNNRHGTYAGDVSFGEDPLASGTSVQLNTTGDSVAFAEVPSFPESSALTVSMWAEVTGDSPTGVSTLFSKASPEDGVAFGLSLFPALENTLAWVVSERPVENLEDLEVFANQQDLTAPSHVVVVYSDSNGRAAGADFARIYVNGVEVASVDNPSGYRDAEDAFQIGARLGDNGLVGLVDDVQVYRVALTAEEVGDLFENPGTILGIEVEPEPEPELVPDGEVAYSQDFEFSDDTVELGDGSIVAGNDGTNSVQDGALRLTQDGVGSTASSFLLPKFNVKEGWTMTFDLTLEAEQGANPPADGFSVNFGALEDNATGSEEGMGDGLAVEFDTWDNDGEGADSGIGYDISVDGADVPDGQMRIGVDDDPFDNRFFKFDGQSRPVEISWTKGADGVGLLTLRVDGEVFYENLPTPDLEPDANFRFGFAARTGGAFETVKIDNLVVTAGGGDGGDGGGGDDDRFASLSDVLFVVPDGGAAGEGAIRFSLPDGVSADIEYSTDLMVWEVIANGVTGEFEESDAARTGDPEGYYRARQP